MLSGLYVAEGLFTVCTATFLLIYMCVYKDRGFLLLAALCGASAWFSYSLVSWYPIIIGGSITAVLMFWGSGLSLFK